jgi:hypothetical protein
VSATVLSLRADLHHAEKKTEQAVLILNALSEDGFLAGRPDLRNYLLSTRLSYHAALAAPDVDKFREEYEAVPKQRRSLVGDFCAYRALGQLYIRREQQERAINAYRLALGAASELYDSLPAAEDKEKFLQIHKPFLWEATECLRQQTSSRSAGTHGHQGLSTVTETALAERTNPEIDQEILALFRPPALKKRPRAGTAVERHRPVVWILMFLNLGLLLISVVALVQKQGTDLAHHPQDYKWVLWLLLLCSGIGLSSCFLSFVAVRSGWTRRFKGTVGLILMLLPTLFVLLITAVFIFGSIVTGP